jgi:hypothetical protein
MNAVVGKFDYANSHRFPAIDDFEAGRLDPESFDHEAHVYIAWQLLEQDDLPVAAVRFTTALKRLTRKLGIEGKYHETISWFYMILIAERRALQARHDWKSFAGVNPDLLSEPIQLLEQHYSSDRLWSALARQQFLLPDLCVQE